MITTDLLVVWAPRVLSIVRIMVGRCCFSSTARKSSRFPRRWQSAARALHAVLDTGRDRIRRWRVVSGRAYAAGRFILSGDMAVAYFMAHAPQSFFPVVNRGDAAILDCFIFFYIFFAGPGPWSVDAMWQRSEPVR